MSKQLTPLPFDVCTTAAWKSQVEKELKGKSYEDHLVWRSLEGVDMEAWQDRRPDPLPELPPLRMPWKIVEPIYQEDAQEANNAALSALMQGAEAVWFFKPYLGAAAEVAAKGIDRSIAPVFIRGNNCLDPYHDLLKHGTASNEHPDGTLLFDGLRLRERGAGVIQELALLISQGLETGNKRGFDVPILFYTGVGNAFLTEIAKIRALRWLWFKVLQREGHPAPTPMVCAVNLRTGYAQNDEHNNVLRATSSAMSAVLGGAQYVMLEPWNRDWKEHDAFGKRISRNVQVLLKEEARLDKNLHPADGSYFIEHLTVELAERAWEQVQKIEQAGGFSAFAKSGKLKEQLASNGQHILDAYASNNATLLGVTAYPPANPVSETAPTCSQYALLPDCIHLPSTLQTSKR